MKGRWDIGGLNSKKIRLHPSTLTKTMSRLSLYHIHKHMSVKATIVAGHCPRARQMDGILVGETSSSQPLTTGLEFPGCDLCSSFCPIFSCWTGQKKSGSCGRSGGGGHYPLAAREEADEHPLASISSQYSLQRVQGTWATGSPHKGPCWHNGVPDLVRKDCLYPPIGDLTYKHRISSSRNSGLCRIAPDLQSQ